MWVSPPLSFFWINRIDLQLWHPLHENCSLLLGQNPNQFLFKQPNHLFDNKKLSYLEAKHNRCLEFYQAIIKFQFNHY